MPKRISFSAEHFILCEGEEDAAFVRAMLAGRNPHLRFDVSPNVDVGNVGGNSGFEASFLAVEPIDGFTDVKHVIILADNDEDPPAALSSIVNRLADLQASNAIKGRWGAPTQAGIQFPGNPSVSIWMWPAPGERGCLETLLWRVISRRYPKAAACAEDACRCTGADKWPLSKFHKALVRCYLSVTCKRNPAISLSLLWRNFKAIIPVKDEALNPFWEFLRKPYERDGE